jgi:hypothetical protein
MSEKGSEPDIEARRFNVAEVPTAEVRFLALVYASTDLKEAMMKAGVLDTPTIYFLEAID